MDHMALQGGGGGVREGNNYVLPSARSAKILANSAQRPV